MDVEKKRISLERFIREQILGPGINGFRFVDLQDSNLENSNFALRAPLDYSNELIDTAPAAVYSTAILFPFNKSSSNSLIEFNDKDIISEDKENNEDEVYDSTDGTKEDSDSSIEDEDTIKIDQMFPNTMGLTCCLDSEVLKSKDLKIIVSGRYYKSIKDESGYSLRYGVRCECSIDILKKVIANHDGLKSNFIIVNKNDNFVLTFLTLEVNVTELRIYLRSIESDIVKELLLKNKSFNFKSTNNFSSLKQSCFYELKKSEQTSIGQDNLYQLSQEVESFENVFTHLKDLIDINDSRNYGLWKSYNFEHEVNLGATFPDEVKLRFISTYAKNNNLKDVFSFSIDEANLASLSLNYQLSKNTRFEDNKIFLKIQLINTSTPYEQKADDSRYFSTSNAEVNKKCFFGIGFRVISEKLVPYNDFSPKNTSESVFQEDEATRYVYRQFKDYGVGHGCSVSWKSLNTIQTDYIPFCDTPLVDTTPRDKENLVVTDSKIEAASILASSNVLSIKWLSLFSTAKDVEVVDELLGFIKNYEQWINQKKSKYSLLVGAEKELVSRELEKCTNDMNRMKENVNLILAGSSNSKNLNTFRLMNSAMFVQMWHSVHVKNNSVLDFQKNEIFKAFDFDFYKLTEDNFFSNSHASWRAFQLAFILLNLDGIFKREDDLLWSKRNDLVDLVWFPTGGGKTEAYLGIIALTIINRRIAYGNKGGGTAAIMRYTLRLLTLQQFQRASLAILALEQIRRWNLYNLGDEPIYIGLWVGNNSLPNKMIDEANGNRDTLYAEFYKILEHKDSKVPFTYCPWCRSILSPSLKPKNGRLDLFCKNNLCTFSLPRIGNNKISYAGPLPVSLCDEEIYEHPPALLFGTVDKFAQLAHKVCSKTPNKDSRRIFGKVREGRSVVNKYLPPDLIIQDELHLLQGPLGSAVALFEAAVDQLCTREDGLRPKIISSTATTRNTGLQIMALFDRQVNIFPKSGVECDDSFFSFYQRSFSDLSNKNEIFKSNRRYIGILPTGRTQIWMQMRLAAIMLTHRALYEISILKEASSPMYAASFQSSTREMDYYHTIISYFNSLKEVGKTQSQIHTYLKKEIRRVFNKVIRPQKLLHSLYTYYISGGELTGRLSGEEVKKELDRLQRSWNPESRFANTGIDLLKNPPDFVVATNMISVGIDVSRFNSIIMNSMPRNIAEYIQASSRVARDAPGLVITIHHPFRARDMSHYEKFQEFHEKMYSYVEPISITPFTKKALDRYLGLYMATMIRHKNEIFINREDASKISDLSELEIGLLNKSCTEYFDKRLSRMAIQPMTTSLKQLLTKENVEYIKNWINVAIKDWQYKNLQCATNASKLVFTNKSSKSKIPQEQLYVDIEEYSENIHSEKWQIPMSLRVVEPEAALKIYRK